MDPEDLFSRLIVRKGDFDQSIEATRSQDGRIEHVESVRRADQPDLPAVIEAIHLRKQLHHRSLDFRIPGRFRVGSFRSNRVDLIDKDDGRLAFGGQLEEISHESSALPDEFLDEFGASHLDEGRIRLIGDGLGEHRFSRPGRAIQQDSGRRIDADRLELFGVTKGYLDGFANFSDLIVESANILVGLRGGMFDLHRSGSSIHLRGEDPLDAKGITDRQAISGGELVPIRARNIH